MQHICVLVCAQQEKFLAHRSGRYQPLARQGSKYAENGVQHILVVFAHQS